MAEEKVKQHEFAPQSAIEATLLGSGKMEDDAEVCRGYDFNQGPLHVQVCGRVRVSD